MPSIKALFVTASALLLIGARAQYTIDPSTVANQTRQDWCNSQIAVCPLLCLQLPGSSSSTISNACNPDLLTYSCTCGNGLSPNASEYSQTLPYYLCQEWVTQCVAGCAQHDSACQSSCTQDHPCGAQNPTRVNVTSTSSVASSTATAATSGGGAATTSAGQVFTGFGGSASSPTSSPSASKNGAQAALDVGSSYGLAIIVAGLFAGFVQIL